MRTRMCKENLERTVDTPQVACINMRIGNGDTEMTPTTVPTPIIQPEPSETRLNPDALTAAYEVLMAHRGDPGRKGDGLAKAIAAYIAHAPKTRQPEPSETAWLDEIERLEKSATKGPWSTMTETRFGGRSTVEEIEVWSDGNDVLIGTEVRRAHKDGGRENMALIVAMRNALPRLVALARLGLASQTNAVAR